MPNVRRLPRFTPQQREVLRLIAEGYTTEEIASALGVTPNTARAHVSRVVDLVRQRGRHELDEEHPLSRREVEVERLLQLGLTDREIAETLEIGLRTAETHTSEVLRKRGVTYRRDLFQP